MSPIRQELHHLMRQYAKALNIKGAKIIDIGILGDPKPSDNYQFFGEGNEWKTMDIAKEAGADYTQDICDCDLPDDEWDLVILSQTLEHVWDFRAALGECYRITKKSGTFIVATPMNEYHGEPNMPDYWRFTHEAYEKMLPEFGYKIQSLYKRPGLVSVVCTK